MPSVKPIPERCHTLNCYVTLPNCKEAIEWYKKAFNAKEHGGIMPCPKTGRVMHAELIIGDSVLMMSDEFPEMKCQSAKSLGGTPFTIMMYVEDVDKVFNQAVQAGAQATMPVTDMFWGDRYGQLVDPWGNKWAIATHKEDLTPEQVAKRGDEFFKQMAGANC